MPLKSVEWKRGRKQAFALWLQEELMHAASDRRPLEKKWRRNIEDWRAKMPSDTVDFPYAGASNAIFPLMAIHTDPVYSDLMATFHASSNFWNCAPRNELNVEKANSLREALKYINEDFLKLRDVNRIGFLYNCVLGTAIYKDHWVDTSKTQVIYDQSGEPQLRNKRISQPMIEHVPLQHFYLPANALSIDPDAPIAPARWVAQKFWLTKSQLKARINLDGEFMPGYDKAATEQVLHFETDKEEETDEFIEQEFDFEPYRDEKIELYEVWARFDANDDGFEEDVVVVFHRDTMKVLRATYNPFQHGKRPFERINYLPTFSFYGMGISEIDEWAQYALTKLLNAQVDNALLANTRMFGYPIGSNIMPDEPLYPGRGFPLGPNEQIQEIRMSDVYPSLPQTMFSFLQWAEQRTGVSELRQGNLTGLPSRTPASTVLSILREGNKRFDMIIANMREPFTRMGKRMIQNFAQFATTGEDQIRWASYFERVMGPGQAEDLFEIVQMQPEEIEREFGISTAATSALANQEIEKQSFVAVLQLVAQLYPQLVQTAQLLDQFPPETKTHQTAAASYAGGVELLQRLLERFDIQNPDQYLPNIEIAQNSMQPQQPAPVDPSFIGVPPPIPFPGGGGAF